jgi:hypothetical protein
MSLVFATQLTAVATVALAVLALATAIVVGLALRKQSRELAILIAENNRQADERHRAQTARMFIGVPYDPPLRVHPYAQNTSEFPVFDGPRTGRRMGQPEAWKMIRRLAARAGLEAAGQISPHPLWVAFIAREFGVPSRTSKTTPGTPIPRDSPL